VRGHFRENDFSRGLSGHQRRLFETKGDASGAVGNQLF
jgi:hypothetical protein